jgi:hypothetical protein
MVLQAQEERTSFVRISRGSTRTCSLKEPIKVWREA